MRTWQSSLILGFLATVAFGQSNDRNPVDDLKDRVTQVLVAAKVPFTPEQGKQLALLIEDERLAAENLFGTIWDFSNGPPQGEQRDKALAGVQWMHDDFQKKLPIYMTDPQKAAWERYASVATPAETRIQSTTVAKGKIQQIRITNNAFNVE